MDATRTYTIVLEPAEEGGFIVHVPALPEVATCGDTEDEALAMAAKPSSRFSSTVSRVAKKSLSNRSLTCARSPVAVPAAA